MGENMIEIRNVTKSYSDFTLNDLNLILPKGCIMGLVGENGAGKSTTIKLILDMIKRDSGSITVLGMDNLTHIKEIKEEVGVVLDEVSFPEEFHVEQINKVMRCIYKKWDEDLFKKYCRDFQLPDKKAFKSFSRGMKMKAGIAVALSHKPKLLLLDEATGGLDPVVREEILDIFNEFTREEEHAVLVSSHIVSDLEKICDYIAFLHKGSLLLCEEKDRILEEYAVLHCTEEEYKKLPKELILGEKKGSYDIEVLVKRDDRIQEKEGSMPNLEQLFLLMVRRDMR